MTSIRRSTRARRPVKSIYDDAKAEQAAAIIETSAGFKNKKKMRTSSILDTPIYNLPDAVLIHISSFVNDASKVLLAVALTASSDAIRKSNYDIEPCPGARAILNQHDQYDHLFNRYKNFEKTEKELAARLSDEDVGGMLACMGDISEIANVNFLAHCVNITGICLGALRGSTTLTKLDLSGVNHLYRRQETKLLESDVIPILDGIIDEDGSALQHIQFPKKWREARSQLLVDFLSKYNRAMNAKNIECRADKYSPDGAYSSCGKICSGTARCPWISKSKELFGVYNFTCFSCHGSYCGECVDENIIEALCERCEKRFCNECNDILTCDNCGETTCRDCTWIDTCNTCSKTFCNQCIPVTHCEFCGKTRCAECVQSMFCDAHGCWMPNCNECADENHEHVKYCVECDVSYCGFHLMERVAADQDRYCTTCKSRAALNLTDSNKLFGGWVLQLEDRYSVKGRDCWNSACDDFSQAVEARKELLQRLRAVGLLLSPKQNQFEGIDRGLVNHGSLLR